MINLIGKKTLTVTMGDGSLEVEARRIEAVCYEGGILVFTEPGDMNALQAVLDPKPDNMFFTELSEEVIDSLQRPKPDPWHRFDPDVVDTWPETAKAPSGRRWVTIDETGCWPEVAFEQPSHLPVTASWKKAGIVAYADPADLKPQWSK